MIATSVARPASGLGLQDNVKAQKEILASKINVVAKSLVLKADKSDPNKIELQPAKADPFKLKDLKEKIIDSNISIILNKHKDSKDKNPLTTDRNAQCDKDKGCLDTQNKELSDGGGDKGTSGGEVRSETHFELPIDIPFP